VAVHIYTETIHRTTRITTEQHKLLQPNNTITSNVVQCGPCPVFANFTQAFAFQLRKKHKKTSVRVRKTSVTVQYTYYQKHAHITKPSQTHTLQNPLIHTLQNNIKPPQWWIRNANAGLTCILTTEIVWVYRFNSLLCVAEKHYVQCVLGPEFYLVFL
jgi:hypothetical protein